MAGARKPIKLRSRINKALRRPVSSSLSSTAALSTTSVVQPTQRAPLLEIPAECRLLIFQQLFLNSEVEIYAKPQDFGIQDQHDGERGHEVQRHLKPEKLHTAGDHDSRSEFLFKIHKPKNASIFAVSKQLCAEAKEALFRETVFVLGEHPVDPRPLLIKTTPLPERVVSQIQRLKIATGIVNQLTSRSGRWQARFSGLKHLIVMAGCRHIYDADYQTIKRLINDAAQRTTVFLGFILNDTREDAFYIRSHNTEMKLLLQGRTETTQSIYNHNRPIFRNIKITTNKRVKRKEEWQDLRALYFIVESLELDRAAILPEIGYGL